MNEKIHMHIWRDLFKFEFTIKRERKGKPHFPAEIEYKNNIV